MLGREKWERFLKGEDVGNMVSPLCDDWAVNKPYQWIADEKEPFRVGHRHHSLSQQMAMADLCKWDPLFLADVDILPKNKDLIPSKKVAVKGEVTVTTTIIPTPYGELSRVEEVSHSSHIAKDFIEEEEDYKKMIWYLENTMDIDEDSAIKELAMLREVVGDRGMIGTWFGPSVVDIVDTQQMFYHINDYEDLFKKVYELKKERNKKIMSLYHKGGFDYLFYIVQGTEWSSPSFFKEWVYDEVKNNIAAWQSEGGFVLWHTCGHAKKFIEEGFYNELKPNIFETLSEAPVGTLPSLEWARKRIDPSIITKGNIPLDTMLCGTPEEVRQQVCRVKEQTKGFRHIIGLGDDIMHNTPYENIVAYVEESRRANSVIFT